MFKRNRKPSTDTTEQQTRVELSIGEDGVEYPVVDGPDGRRADPRFPLRVERDWQDDRV